MNAPPKKFVLVAETGYLGMAGRPLGGPGHFASDSGPPLSAVCNCGVNDLKKPHADWCSFGKPL